VLAVFQPHRYSRTLHCHDGFLSAFHDCDFALITDVYAAGEDPIPGVTGEKLVAEIKSRNPEWNLHHVADLETARDRIVAEARPGDMIICLGAGSITRLPESLAEALGKKFP